MTGQDSATTGISLPTSSERATTPNESAAAFSSLRPGTPPFDLALAGAATGKRLGDTDGSPWAGGSPTAEPPWGGGP